MNQISPPTRASSKRLMDCKTLQEAFDSSELIAKIEKTLPGHLNPEKMLNTFVQATKKQPELLLVDWKQVIGGCLTLSQLGLEPNTPLNHAYLIPFKTKIYNRKDRKMEDGYDLSVVLGYPGMAELMWRTGVVTNIRAAIAWEDELDVSFGTDAKLVHRPNFKIERTTTPDVAYAHVAFEFRGGSKGQAFEVMSMFDVIKIRNRSQSYRAALAAKENAEKEGRRIPKAYTEAPWVRDFGPMATKCPFRRLWKMMPKSPDMLNVAIANDLEDRQEAGKSLDFGSVIEGDLANGVPEQNEPAPIAETFGVREATVMAKPAAETVAKDQAIRKQETPRTAPPKAEPPMSTANDAEQEWPLYNSSGEVVSVCPDSEIWYDQFSEMALRVKPDIAQAFFEFNEDCIARGRLVSKTMSDSLDALTKLPESFDPAATADAWTPPVVGPVPMNRSGAVDPIKLQTMVDTALGFCYDAAQIEAFRQSLPDEWKSLEAGSRLVILRAFAARKMSLGIPVGDA
jgi:recombination protein RecT